MSPEKKIAEEYMDRAIREWYDDVDLDDIKWFLPNDQPLTAKQKEKAEQWY